MAEAGFYIHAFFFPFIPSWFKFLGVEMPDSGTGHIFEAFDE